MITLMGLEVLRTLVSCARSCTPAWFAIIGDEATDVSCAEQLKISIRYVDVEHEIHEDSIVLFQLSSTDAASIAFAIKDILIRCSFPLSLCRGQAYNGGTTMQGKWSGVATHIRNEDPATIPVHCLAHSLNLCLQDAARGIITIHDALDML